MINETSRYATDLVVSTVKDGLARNAIVLRPPVVETFNFTYYQWAQGDRVDIVAREFFDDETLWWIVAMANPEILVWSSLPVGTVIRIPDA